MRIGFRWGALLVVTALFFLAEPVRADNCGSLWDCYGTIQAAVAATVGLAVFAAVLSIGLELIPVVGEIKGIIEAITGKDRITGEDLAWYERVLGVVPIGGALIGGAIAIGRGARRASALVEVVGDAGRVVNRAGDLGGIGRAAERMGEVGGARKLVPGMIEHKAERWAQYQARNGTWTYERWSKQYDINIENATRGLKREADYRTIMEGENRILETAYGNRQIDIYIEAQDYAGQVKTGKQYLTARNRLAIERDAWLITNQRVQVEWILEKGGSKQLLKALRDAGIEFHIGSKVP